MPTKQDEKAHNESSRFEQLISELSATFVNLPADQVDKEIERGLQLIVTFMDHDRSSLFQYEKEKKELCVTHSWAARGFEQITGCIAGQAFPYMTGKILNNEIFQFSRLDDLPDEASLEKKFFLKAGQKSGVAIPLHLNGSVIGALTFCTFRFEKMWPEELMRRFRIIGEIFVNALDRRQTDMKLQAALSQS